MVIKTNSIAKYGTFYTKEKVTAFYDSSLINVAVEVGRDEKMRFYFTNSQEGISVYEFTDEQLDWTKTDLYYVSSNVPLYLAYSVKFKYYSKENKFTIIWGSQPTESITLTGTSKLIRDPADLSNRNAPSASGWSLSFFTIILIALFIMAIITGVFAYIKMRA